jgi:hypothetical protein
LGFESFLSNRGAPVLNDERDGHRCDDDQEHNGTDLESESLHGLTSSCAGLHREHLAGRSRLDDVRIGSIPAIDAALDNRSFNE